MYSLLQFIYYGDPLPSEEENALYISNHQCTGIRMSSNLGIVDLSTMHAFTIIAHENTILVIL